MMLSRTAFGGIHVLQNPYAPTLSFESKIPMETDNWVGRRASLVGGCTSLVGCLIELGYFVSREHCVDETCLPSDLIPPSDISVVRSTDDDANREIALRFLCQFGPIILSMLLPYDFQAYWNSDGQNSSLPYEAGGDLKSNPNLGVGTFICTGFGSSNAVSGPSYWIVRAPWGMTGPFRNGTGRIAMSKGNSRLLIEKNGIFIPHLKAGSNVAASACITQKEYSVAYWSQWMFPSLMGIIGLFVAIVLFSTIFAFRSKTMMRDRHYRSAKCCTASR